MELKTSGFDPVYDLSAEQIAAISALMEGKTNTEAAMIADVSRSTLNRWLQEPAFRQALRDAKSESLDVVGRKLLKLGSTAVDTLQTILDNSQSENVKVRAAVDSLNQLFRAVEVLDISERLAEIERRLSEGR